MSDDITLKDFIAQSISQIMDGVREAQDDAEHKGGIVDPIDDPGRRSGTYRLRVRQDVEFDVAVTVRRQRPVASAGAFGVFVLRSKGDSNAEDSTTSRIRFTVPVIFPRQAASDSA